jgi:hypothetical protein
LSEALNDDLQITQDEIHVLRNRLFSVVSDTEKMQAESATLSYDYIQTST